jgi:hypothetical protein
MLRRRRSGILSLWPIAAAVVAVVEISQPMTAVSFMWTLKTISWRVALLMAPFLVAFGITALGSVMALLSTRKDGSKWPGSHQRS